MAKGFGARLANALAIGIGAGMEGYGKGTLQVAMNAREEYQQRLRDERAAAMQREERGWREGEAEKGREFEREQFQERQEWEREKFNLELGSAEKRAELQMRVKQAGGGRGGSAPVRETAKMKEARFLAAAKYGENPTDAQIAEFMRPERSGGGSTAREPTSIQEARFKARAKYGPDATDAQVAEFLDRSSSKGSGDDDKVAAAFQRDFQKNMEMLGDPLSQTGLKYVDNPEQLEIDAMEKTKSQWSKVGRKLPTTLQESKAEAPQPQELEAPPTDTSGAKPTDSTPQGQGTEASPYVVESEAHKEWFLRQAPPGAWVIYGGKKYQKKAE